MQEYSTQYYGVKVFYTRKTFFYDDYVQINEKFNKYDYLGIKQVPLNSSADLIIPFSLERRKTYYLLVGHYKKQVDSGFELNTHYFIELFKNENYAKEAIKYLTFEKTPTYHEVLEAGSQINNFNGFDINKHSFSVNSQGRVCILENLPWTGKSKVFEKLRIMKFRY